MLGPGHTPRSPMTEREGLEVRSLGPAVEPPAPGGRHEGLALRRVRPRPPRCSCRVGPGGAEAQAAAAQPESGRVACTPTGLGGALVTGPSHVPGHLQSPSEIPTLAQGARYSDGKPAWPGRPPRPRLLRGTGMHPCSQWVPRPRPSPQTQEETPSSPDKPQMPPPAQL